MWPFDKKPKRGLQDRIKTAHELITGLADRVTPDLMKGVMGEDWQVRFPSYYVFVHLEVIVFQLHLTDRIVNGRMREHREEFMDALLPLTFVNLPEDTASRLQQVYNERQILYGSCKKIFADKDEALGGTLIWEFGKIIVEKYTGSLDASLMLVPYSLGTHMLQTLNDGYKALDVC